VEDADIGEQFTVVPVQEGDQELSVDVNAANGDTGIDVAEQPVDGFDAFSAVTVPYDGQPEVVFDETGYKCTHLIDG